MNKTLTIKRLRYTELKVVHKQIFKSYIKKSKIDQLYVIVWNIKNELSEVLLLFE